MPKLDDDEGDEKSAYAANKRLSGGGGGKDDDDGDGEDDLLSPVVRSFCHHVVSSKFRKELDAFFGARCDGFEEADAEEAVPSADAAVVMAGWLRGVGAKGGRALRRSPAPAPASSPRLGGRRGRRRNTLKRDQTGYEPVRREQGRRRPAGSVAARR